MLRCKDVANKVSDYVDNKLPLKTKLGIKMHLLMCYKCSRYVDQLKTTIRALAKLRDTDVDAPNKKINAELLDAFRKKDDT